ncbi:MAG: CBS domain-containing protein [Sulfuriflexus sp.]|nr:CBS domain-containing protein [Sulfuriflexus sp.]
MSVKKIIRVSEIMKKKFDIVEGITTVSEALDKMTHIENKSLIVNKRNDDDEYGIVLLADIARNVLAKDRAPERVNIYEIMSKPVITVEANMDIRYCARLFAKFKLTRAPVVEDGKIVGMVSYTDMVLKGMAGRMD